MNSVFAILPSNLRDMIRELPEYLLAQLEEIRLRVGQPLLVNLANHDLWLSPAGKLAYELDKAYWVAGADLEKTLHLLTNSSMYALEEELRNGFITCKGGHRVGLVGQTVLEQGRIKTMKHISSLNIRVARQFYGVANRVLPYLFNSTTQQVYHSLIVSPPCCGKTTLLRDLIRQISMGSPQHKFAGVTVGLVDERSEVAACYRGKPQMDVGPRTDVLDRCPKADGMMLLIRSMGPRVIAVDEIGRAEDFQAVEEVLNAGIKLITTVHGSSLAEISRRPGMARLINQHVFERLVFLDRQNQPGHLREILDGGSFKTLFTSSSSSQPGRREFHVD